MIKKNYTANKPELKKNCYIVGLLSGSNLQVTTSRVGVSVFKEKSDRLKGLLFSRKPFKLYLLFFSFLFFKRARTNSYV